MLMQTRGILSPTEKLLSEENRILLKPVMNKGVSSLGTEHPFLWQESFLHGAMQCGYEGALFIGCEGNQILGFQRSKYFLKLYFFSLR